MKKLLLFCFVLLSISFLTATFFPNLGAEEQESKRIDIDTVADSVLRPYVDTPYTDSVRWRAEPVNEIER